MCSERPSECYVVPVSKTNQVVTIVTLGLIYFKHYLLQITSALFVELAAESMKSL